MAIVKATFLTRGRTGQQAAKSARQAAKYYTFRNGPDRLTRIWQTRDGRTGSYADLGAEIAAAATAYAYSYRLVVSTEDVDLGVAGDHQVLSNRFAQYYFIEHHNTAYPHAHVIGFRTRLLRQAELEAMRTQACQLERARAQELQLQRAPSPSRPSERQGQRRPQRAHERDHGIDGPGGD